MVESRSRSRSSRLLVLGGGPAQLGLLEAAHVIAIFNYFPRMADGFGLVPDPKVREAGETGVPLKRVEG